MNIDTRAQRRRLIIVGATGAAALLVSILMRIVLGELPELLWLLFVPIGMFGGGAALLVSLVLLARSSFGNESPNRA